MNQTKKGRRAPLSNKEVIAGVQFDRYRKQVKNPFPADSESLKLCFKLWSSSIPAAIFSFVNQEEKGLYVELN